MNFKVNWWTLLFAIASVAAVYLYSCRCIHSDTDTATVDQLPCKRCHPSPNDYKIYPGTALEWMESYKNYARTMMDTTLVKNPNVRYFELPRCEMVEMINNVGENSDVHAHLAIDDSDQLIKLVFQDIRKKERTDASAPGDEYFDFTQPCPTYCEA